MELEHAVHVWGIRHGERWTVTVDDDPTPIVERRTRAEAETDARAHAETFGYEYVVVHELDGEKQVIRIPNPDPKPPYPGGAKGAPAG
ncbi:MAG: hypothetical protein QOG77_612 [Solirubrobacteraceae bacterium]|jgi:hypothetical protein|nr:hypothetical protein [Solirubrobacteraceae bacterium]